MHWGPGIRSSKIMPSFLLSLLAAAVAVEATYSIVATDEQTRQVGGAGATCIPSTDVFDALYLSAPNRSVLHTQGQMYGTDAIKKTAMEMMERNEPIDVVLKEMQELDTDPWPFGEFLLVDMRQYGMADFNADSHGGYTGKSLQTIYDDVLLIENTEQVDTGAGRNDVEGTNGTVRGRHSFHAQGNVVAEGTVTTLSDGFLGGGGDDRFDPRCDMAARLMAAMNGVAEGGLGDVRCISDHGGVSATGAFLHVDEADGTELIHINEIGDGSYEPVEEVNRQFLVWRESNCRGAGNSADDQSLGNETAAERVDNATAPNPPTTQASGCTSTKVACNSLLGTLCMALLMFANNKIV